MAAIGVRRYRVLTLPFRILVVIIIFTFISEAVSLCLAINYGLSFPVYHFYVIVSFAMYSIIYQFLLEGSKVRFAIRFITIPLILFCITNSFLFQGIKTFPSINIVVSSVFLVTYALLYFRQLLDQRVDGAIVGESYFLFNIAILAFFSSQIFNWGIYNYLLKSRINPDAIVIFGYVMSVLFYTLLGFTILMDNKSKSTVKQSDKLGI